MNFIIFQTEGHSKTKKEKPMISNPVFILAAIALLLAVVSYWPGAPTLGVAVILLAIAILIGLPK